MTRIVNLIAENYKRIVAVDITPSGNVVKLSGSNAQGKTSILDAIWAALAGGDASRATQQPIRDGQDNAFVRLELDDYIVTRRWTKDDAGTVTVEAKVGGKFSSPQKLLDSLIGKRAFDPLAFTRQTPAEQVETLAATVDLPFDPAALEKERKGVYDDRTEIGRKVRELEGQLAGYPEHDDSIPAEEVSVSAILREVEEARMHNRLVDDTMQALVESQGHVTAQEQRIADLEASLLTARGRLAELREAEEKNRTLVDGTERRDVDALTDRLEGVEAENVRIRAQQQRSSVARQLAARKEAQAQRTIELNRIDKAKADGLAEVKFPVDGLSFADGGVTYNGVPFSQASAAEKWRVSLALGMATNTGLRIIQVRDGSLLDSESMRIVEELAAEHDYQCWIEVVDETGKVGIVIEDGRVKS